MTETDEEPTALPASTPRRWDWRPKLRWFAAEFLVVVSGILVALALNAGWADWQTRGRAEAFTARLTNDLRYEAWSYEYLVEYHKDVLAGAEAALAGLSADSAMSDEAFVIAAYRATQFKYQERHRATYDELVSTGEMGLITDDTLRVTAVDVFTVPLFDILREEGRNSEYRRVFRRLVSADVQDALLQSCGDRNPEPGDFAALVGSLDYACDLDLAPGRVAAAAAALRADPAVLPALQLRFADLQTTMVDLTTNFPAMRRNLRRIVERAS